MNPASFDRLRLAAPLDALVGVVLLVGLVEAGRRVAATAWGRRVGAAGSVAAVMGLSSVAAYALVAMHMAPLWTLRAAGAVLALLAVDGVTRRRRELAAFLPRPSARIDWLVVAVLALFALACLGPPTEADSLVYHLAAPARWLHEGAVTFEGWWLAYRVAGPGEGLVALGLACGTDVLGPLVALASVVLIAAALAELVSLAGGAAERARWARLALLSAPMWLYYVPSAKNQALGAALLLLGAVALVRTAQRDGGFARHRVALGIDLGILWGAAIACKPTFAVPATVIGLAALVALPGSRARLFLALVQAAVTALVLGLPYYGTNGGLYGDPLSPLLARVLPAPIHVQAFTMYMKDLTAPDRSPASLLGALRTAAVPRDTGWLTFALGPLLVAMPFVAAAVATARPRRDARTFLGLAAGLGLVVHLVVLPFEPRYLLEPALLGLVLVCVVWPERLAIVARIGLPVAVLPVLAGAGYAAVTIGPGAVSEAQRDRVMTRASYDWAVWRWAGPQVAGDPAVVTDGALVAFAPTPVVHSAFVLRQAFPPHQRSYLAWMRGYKAQRTRALGELADWAKLHGARHWLVRSREMSDIAAACTVPGPSATVPDGRRSPFNEATVQVELRRIDWSLPACIELLPDEEGPR